jgi:hypothetical protein
MKSFELCASGHKPLRDILKLFSDSIDTYFNHTKARGPKRTAQSSSIIYATAAFCFKAAS